MKGHKEKEKMIDLEEEVEVVEALEAEAETGEDNLLTKLLLSAFDVINRDIFLMNVLVGKKQLIMHN